MAGWFIGEGGISAINNASQVMQILTQIIMGITTGGNILMSQYYGSRDPVNREKTNRTLFFFSVTAGAVMTVAVLVLSRPILIGLRAPALEEATAYLTVCALGLIPIFGYNALSAMVNIVLDCLFMGAFHWGVRGAALATVMAQTASFVVCLWYVRRHQDLFGLTRRRGGIERAKLTQMLKLGIPSAVQMTVVGLSWLAMTFLINDYGVDASAASGICAKIKDIALLSTLALYTAATTVIAQCLGAGKFDRASRVVHVAMMALAVQNLRIEILGQIVYASFMVYNALPMGAGHTMFALASSLLNCIVVRVVLAVILNHVFGLVGIFWACAIAPASSVPLGYIYEKRGKWRRRLVQGPGDALE